MEKINWALPEYPEKEHSIEWFWALGVIVVASTITSVIYENYFFAGILVIGGVLMGYFADKKPDIISYELNDRGFLINNRLYEYKNIHAFWVRQDINPTLFLKSERVFMPILIIPIEEEKALSIREYLLTKKIEEVEMKEHPGEAVMEYLGF